MREESGWQRSGRATFVARHMNKDGPPSYAGWSMVERSCIEMPAEQRHYTA